MTLICVIGLPRSGTTLLGRALAGLPGAVYHEEPNPMWRFRNFRRLGHEQFTAADATPEVRRYIRSVLASEEQGLEASLTIEKTPANCIRIGFVEAVLPEARIIFLTRNGDDVRASILRKWQGGIDSNGARLNDDVPFRALRAKLVKSRYIHSSEKLLYLRAELSAKWSMLRRGSTDYWGPMVRNWQSLRGLAPERVVDESCACMEAAYERGVAGCALPHAVVAYEDLVRAPRTVLQESAAPSPTSPRR